MTELEQLMTIVSEMRKNSDYSILDNIPDEFSKSKQEINKITSLVYSKLSKKQNFPCLFPNCENKPIKSHSIQKALLKNIADETNHLTKISISAEFRKNGKIKAVIEHPSINDASTFDGYCNSHDTSIFLPIEQNEIDPNNEEHNFLLLYRSVVREYFQSRKSYFLLRDLVNDLTKDMSEENLMGPLLIIQLYNQFCEYFRIEKMKETLDSCYLSKIYNFPFQYYHISIDKEYPVFVNTFYAIQGVKGGIIYRKNIMNELPLFCSLTMIPCDGKTNIFYAVLKEQVSEVANFLQLFEETNIKIFELFLSDNILRNSDNFFISTKYWEKIPDNDKKYILDFYLKSTNNREIDLNNNINLFKYMEET